MSGASATAVDLGDPLLYVEGDPQRAWAELRRHAPVYRNAATSSLPAFWAITRYADVVEIARDPDRFRSAPGNMLSTLTRGGDPAGGRMLVVTDPPHHGEVRRLLAGAFAPRTLHRLEETVRETVVRLVGDAVSAEECDFVQDVAAKLPMAVVCDLLGVPREDWETMLDLTNRAFASDTPAGGDAAADVREAYGEILLYYSRLAELRRRRPRDDLVSVLVGAEGEEILDADEVFLNCCNLIIGGNETTRHAASGGVLALVEHPAEWQRLKRDPALVSSAVDEILRWTSPVMHVLRTVEDEVVCHGHRLARSEPVTLWLASANRDEDAFADAQSFHVGRRENRHVAFGVGPHYCLGAFLARLELSVLFEELVRSVDRIELTGAPEPIASNFVAGLRRLPVRLRPRSPGGGR